MNMRRRRHAAPGAPLPTGSGGTLRGGEFSNSLPFRVDESGVFWEDPSGSNSPLKICGPLEVLGRTRDDQGNNWGCLLQWFDHEGRKHQWAMPAELLAGDDIEYRKQLHSGGLWINPNKQARERLSLYISSAAPKQVLFRCVQKLGWHGEHFVFPDASVPASAERILFQPSHTEEHRSKVNGTLDDWKEHVAKLCAGNSRLVFPVCCTLAGPLLKLLNEESGGFHLLGPSSIGKTSSLTVAGSVLGGGHDKGFVRSWNTTANAVEAIAEMHNDQTLILDEIKQAQATDIVKTAYTLANGQGKGRAGKTGGARPVSNWKLILISSGEETLTQLAVSVNQRVPAGAQLRLADVPADAGARMGIFEDLHGEEDPRVFAKTISEAALRCYGTPIRALVSKIVAADRAVLRQRITRIREKLITKYLPVRASSEVGRILQRFVLVAIAGELATEYGITGWNQGEAESAMAKCFHAYLSHRGTSGPGDEEEFLRHLRAFLASNANSRFEPLNDAPADGKPPMILNRVGFVETKNEQTLFLVPRDNFPDICKGHDPSFALQVLVRREYLQRDGSHNSIRRKVPVLGTIQVYAIKASVLREEFD